MTAFRSLTQDDDTVGLIHVSITVIVLSMAPLFVIALMSANLGLQLEKSIVVGTFRTFVQLSILGTILSPIFILGEDYWWVVVIYCFFMVVLASSEATTRIKYYFTGMFVYILGAVMANITLVSCFAFGVLLRPKPVWDPQYVIPIIGMLLGNAMSGVSLTMNGITTSFVEQVSEVDLLLAFGATPSEASNRLVQDAVRVGATPMLNNMAVIGLISIPGMMTGQILAGSPVMEAARYQMLIIYLISIAAFGTILSSVWIVRSVAFDSAGMLRENCFLKQKTSLFSRMVRLVLVFCVPCWKSRSVESDGSETGDSEHDSEKQPLSRSTAESKSYGVDARIEFVVIHSSKNSGGSHPLLEVRNLSRTFYKAFSEKVLFQDMSQSVGRGTLVIVRGPSGVGKSQLVRAVARLVPISAGELLLDGSAYIPSTEWRRQVLYVGQLKIDLPGTPHDFIHLLTTFQSWRRYQDTTTETGLLDLSREYAARFGLNKEDLDKEWKQLSGGEAQRVHLAIAIASKPRVLLLDEVTSALDSNSKKKVEECVVEQAQQGMGIMWITHEQAQVERLQSMLG